MKKEIVKEKGNTCGIVGLSLCWVPLVGLILGIIALSRKEKTPALGILAILLGVFFWILWVMMSYAGGVY